MSHWIHPDAEAELGDAAVYYAEQASRRIAEAFLEEYERVREFSLRTRAADLTPMAICASITSTDSPTH